MAIDKSRMQPIVKVGIGVLAVFLVISLGGSFIPGLATLFQGASGSQTGQQTGQGVLDQAAAKYGSRVLAMEQQLASDPTSYTLLIYLGNDYSDWASEAQTATGDVLTASLYRDKAIDAYAQALAVKPGDPYVTVDYAIALFYNGRVDAAIKAAESVLVKDPKFAPALFNGGIFYAEASRPTDAARVLNEYLKADPSGQFGNPDYAKQLLAQVSANRSTPTPTSSAPATP